MSALIARAVQTFISPETNPQTMSVDPQRNIFVTEGAGAGCEEKGGKRKVTSVNFTQSL